MQPSCYSSREANSLIYNSDCLMKHLPRLWSSFLLPSSLTLVFTSTSDFKPYFDCLGFAGRSVMKLDVHLRD